MFRDQFDVHPKVDTDHMVMVKIDRDYNHEECQAKTYLHQSLAVVVRYKHLKKEEGCVMKENYKKYSYLQSR